MDQPATGTTSDGVPRTPTYAWYVLAILFFVYVLNFVDRQIISILAEDIKRDLHLRDEDLGFLYGTAFGVFYALFGIPLGRLADNWHRVRLMAAGLALWSTMTMLSGFARGGAMLSGARVGVGIGEAGQLLGEDDRVASTVGVEEPDASRRIGQRRTDERHDRRDPAAARERDQIGRGRIALPEDELAVRRGGLQLGTRSGGVIEPVRHHAAGISFDGDPQLVLDRSRRHRVAAAQVPAVDGDPHGEELTGLVAELVRAVLGHIQHQ